MSLQIFVTVKVPGIHYWPEASQQAHAHTYLENPHRHIFHIKVIKTVTEYNREIEFLSFADFVMAEIHSNWYLITQNLVDFGTCSCEQIAQTLLRALDADQVEVSEDGENGAIVTTDRDA